MMIKLLDKDGDGTVDKVTPLSRALALSSAQRSSQ